MGGRQIRPARVFKTVSQQLQHEVFKGHQIPVPPWYQVMHEVPPIDTIIRTIPPRHRMPGPKAPKKPKKLYRPQSIKYEEDALRTTFFKDHPWELARPRVILESDGKDYQYLDWSKGLRQPGMALTGECVVQRQMWLMHNENMSRNKAYDVARREFYRLRQAEEIEKRVAVEEARHVGAYFGKTRLDVGMLLEDREYENWKIWAGKEAAAREALENEVVDTYDVDDDPSSDALEHAVAEALQPVEAKQ
ncbi:37S ribosomal protein S25 [Paramyrothecium foliicola]|nr:37S ribosomal protein S25 [Paramyrothecium foliicola]